MNTKSWRADLNRLGLARAFRFLLVSGVTILMGLLLVGPAFSQPTGATLTKLAEEGENLYRLKCMGCHSLGEGDRQTGPDLAGVTERRNREWLINFIGNPGKMVANGDPIAVQLLAKFNNLLMPTLRLKSDQVEALLIYFAHPEEAAHHAQEPATEAIGNAARGGQLYSGSLAMTNGGSPCIACHALSGFGSAGAASYGPDLSNLYADYGEEGVLSVLETLPFPSMEPIYASRPLTAEERLDLTAFFAQTAAQQAPPAKSLAGLILLGVVIVFAIVALLGLRRLKGVRQPLIDQVRKQRGM
ncbi:c-type cytochrome [Geopsychrobacter electrodiphilus]|uniref:c-type cytochrome n=1 Tax=Geopsychrobacter electrodiphilus TaxID=225196 RepID=UPI0003634DE8|nr:c-type cytochrome [Geopsychrobacter electrodiphilus]